MPTNRQFSMTLQALTELKTETSTPPSQPRPAAPALRDVLAEIGPLPTEALFLGVATDGLPVLLNLYDFASGPILMAGDAGTGKTAFLQTIAKSVQQTDQSNDLQFGVITNYPDEWENVELTSHHVGIFPVGQSGTCEFVSSLASWAHSNKNTHQCVLLLVDDLELVASLDLETVQNFRWLLLRGPARRGVAHCHAECTALRTDHFVAAKFPHTYLWPRGECAVVEALGGDKASGLDQLERRI